jgi:hypothetical protein
MDLVLPFNTNLYLSLFDKHFWTALNAPVLDNWCVVVHLCAVINMAWRQITCKNVYMLRDLK